jgi:parallel beta-helix repeat protein
MTVSSANEIYIEKQTFEPMSFGNTLYVGGKGPGNYSKIKDAYNDANPGDTIFVYSGTYYEYLHIEKTINLIGENKDTTKIRYNHKSIEILQIEAPDVIVSGFTLYNPNPNLVVYIEIVHKGRNVTISNCIFHNSPLHFDDRSVGINIGNSSHNRISNCTFLYNDDEGICLNYRSYYNVIENCVFSNCMGIEFENSSHNIVKNCIMEYGDHGITMIPTYKNTTSNNNIIINCNIYNYDGYGIYLQDGSINNVVYNCSLNYNLRSGISIGGKNSYNNLIVNNKISNSTMCSFGGGLQLGWSCHNNTFSNNHISNCNNGVYIEDTFNTDDCNDNLFYHNNFIDNDRGAYDECDNIWDKAYPTGGNYWSDYTGIDNDGDGIGDTPYDISGPKDNKDYYPLMEPWIADELTVKASGPYYGLINKPLQFHGLAVGGRKPYIWFWDFGDGNTSDEQNPPHTYTEAGKYDIILNVTDNSSNSSSDTTFAWIQETNDPPDKPTIKGETNGKIKTEYNYSFLSSDPEGLHIWYFIDWRDGTDTGWIGPYPSGKEINKSHSWLEKGEFAIRCKCKDPYGNESEWGELRVTIPKNQNVFLSNLFDRFPVLYQIINHIMERWSL